jgi:hypothetical protein
MDDRIWMNAVVVEKKKLETLYRIFNKLAVRPVPAQVLEREITRSKSKNRKIDLTHQHPNCII